MFTCSNIKYDAFIHIAFDTNTNLSMMIAFFSSYA